MNRIIVSDDAQADLIDGFHFYERQAAGLGDVFLESVMNDIDALIGFAGVHALHFGKHRLLYRRFPFSIYYDSKDDLVRVIAVLDQRRDPAWIRKRLV